MLAQRFPRAQWPNVPLPARWALAWMAGAPFVLPAFIAYDINALPASAPLALRHFFHLPIIAWTVRTQADRETARRWADQIIFEGFDPDAS
jgi:glycerophosphoryl diester phosphodiesterase